MFKKTVFWRFVDVDMVVNSPIIHHMLLREVKRTRSDSMSFSVCGKVVTFLKDDFLLMTGLWQSPTRVDRNQQSSYELAIKYFGNRVTKDTSHLRQLEEKYKDLEFENDDDVVKISLVYYTEVAMMGKNKQKDAINLKRFKDVQNLKYYNSLDWGTIIWERTLDALKIALNDKSSLYKTRVKANKNYVVKYSLRGFSQAFYVWTYEILASSIAGNIAERRSKREIFESNNIKVKKGTVMSDAEREFRDTLVDRRPIFELGGDDDSSESGNRLTSEGGSPESESDGDDHRGDDNDEVVRVEGGDELEHSEHEDAEYGRVKGGTYTPSDDMMGDVREEDELNQLDVYLANSGRERPVDDE
ncbi:uncharacterized protein LOC120088810 [Benincasa hispida]|uniref:uncharacterized protein LOC120088810 n=1 Tax=Benincasa hispida TaxID=102211 RepID=UPI0019009129|nr:uncharacterized protein LOC120088810 [Benincasa hispida]